MNRIYTLLFLFFLISTAKAQDPQFSVFTTSPLLINPATTGYFQNDCWRAIVNHRNQWGSFLSKAFQTSTVSFDMPFETKNIGVGVVISQNSATKGSMTKLNVLGSFSYRLRLTKDNKQFVVLGLQGGIINNSFQQQYLKFGNQYEPGVGYVETKGNGETFAAESALVPDINFGAIWYKKDAWAKVKPWVSLSSQHLIEPKKLYSNTASISLKDAKLPRKYLVYAGAEIDFSKEFGATPVVTYDYQGNQSQLQAGASAKYTFYKEKAGRSVQLGAFYRTQDAVVAMLGFETNGFSIILDYEVNTSSLKEASKGVGGFEVTLRYVKQCNNANIKFGF